MLSPKFARWRKDVSRALSTSERYGSDSIAVATLSMRESMNGSRGDARKAASCRSIRVRRRFAWVVKSVSVTAASVISLVVPSNEVHTSCSSMGDRCSRHSDSIRKDSTSLASIESNSTASRSSSRSQQSSSTVERKRRYRDCSPRLRHSSSTVSSARYPQRTANTKVISRTRSLSNVREISLP